MTLAIRTPSSGEPVRRDDDLAEHGFTTPDRLVSGLERNWRWVLVGLMLADVALLLYMGRGLTFFFDDWDYVTHDYGGGIHSLLQAHNGHLSLIPIAIYKVLFHVVGLNHYAVFRLVDIALHLICAGLVFLLASRRVSHVPALLATALILFLGVAWEDLLWAFQIDYLLSIAGGLAAFALLERCDLRGDLAATVAIAVSLGSSGLGIPVLIGVAVELAWRREWRRGFVVVIPVVLYLLWYLHYGEQEITRTGLINAPGFAEDMAAAAFGGLLGRSLEWGRPIAVLGYLVLLRRLARPVVISARLAGLLAVGLSLWFVTASARSTISTPETGRYVYLGAVVIVLVGVELLRDVVLTARMLALAMVVVAVAVVTGLTALHSGAMFLRSTSATVSAELGAMELAAAYAAPTYQPDPARAPQIFAEPFLHTVRAIGSSPADSPAVLAAGSPASRAAADAVLIALYALTPTTSMHTSASPLAPPPAVAGLTSGTQVRRGSCIDLTPRTGATMTTVLVLPRGGVAIRDRGSATASAAVKRFGDMFSTLATPVPPHDTATLSIPADRVRVPWQLQLGSASPLSVCGVIA